MQTSVTYLMYCFLYQLFIFLLLIVYSTQYQS